MEEIKGNIKIQFVGLTYSQVMGIIESLHTQGKGFGQDKFRFHVEFVTDEYWNYQQ